MIDIKDSFSNRLQKAINYNNIKPIELSDKTGIDRSLISSYLSGRYKAKDENLYKLAKALDVNEAWLEGYDVPIKENSENTEEFDELSILFDKTKDILTESDKAIIKTIMEERKKEIDRELGED